MQHAMRFTVERTVPVELLLGIDRKDKSRAEIRPEPGHGLGRGRIDQPPQDRPL